MILSISLTLLMNLMIDTIMNSYIQMENREYLIHGKKLDVNGSVFHQDLNLI